MPLAPGVPNLAKLDSNHPREGIIKIKGQPLFQRGNSHEMMKIGGFLEIHVSSQ